MVDGPHGAGRIETVSVMNGNGTLTSTSTSAPALASTSAPSTGIAQIASSHPDGETLPSTGPVTQGEILRQEQEAGVVLSNPHAVNPNRTLIADVEGGANIVDTVEGEEEVPHARGPEVIGMEDTGPQRQGGGGLDIEGAVGRPSLEGGRASKSPGPATEAKDEEMQEDGSNEKKDSQAEQVEKPDVEAKDADMIVEE